MSYRGFLVPVLASDIRIIEDMTADELRRYVSGRQMLNHKEGNEGVDFFSLIGLLEKNYEVKSVDLAGWFLAMDEFCMRGKPLFNRSETQNMVADFRPFVAGTEALRFLQDVFEEIMLASKSSDEQQYYREIFDGLLELERNNDLFLIYSW